MGKRAWSIISYVFRFRPLLSNPSFLTIHIPCYPLSAEAHEDYSYGSSKLIFLLCIRLSVLTFLSMFVFNSNACKKMQPEMS